MIIAIHVFTLKSTIEVETHRQQSEIPSWVEKLLIFFLLIQVDSQLFNNNNELRTFAAELKNQFLWVCVRVLPRWKYVPLDEDEVSITAAAAINSRHNPNRSKIKQ